MKWINYLSVLDFLLLLALLAASFTHQRDLVKVLGPIHGGVFVLLLTVCATSAIDRLLPLWFPILVLVTGGPPGSFLGAWILSRRSKRKKSR